MVSGGAEIHFRDLAASALRHATADLVALFQRHANQLGAAAVITAAEAAAAEAAADADASAPAPAADTPTAAPTSVASPRGAAAGLAAVEEGV